MVSLTTSELLEKKITVQSVLRSNCRVTPKEGLGRLNSEMQWSCHSVKTLLLDRAVHTIFHFTLMVAQI